LTDCEEARECDEALGEATTWNLLIACTPWTKSLLWMSLQWSKNTFGYLGNKSLCRTIPRARMSLSTRSFWEIAEMTILIPTH